MAAGMYTLVSVLDEMKKRLEGKDVNIDRLTDDQYEEFIYRNIISTESTYTLQKTTTVWRYLGGDEIYLEIASSGAWSSIPDDTTWTLYATGTMKQETGTAYTSDITITGTPVRFNWAMADCLEALRTLHSSDYSVTTGVSTLHDVGSVKRMLGYEAAMYRGGYGV